jgi:hypothetical protein
MQPGSPPDETHGLLVPIALELAPIRSLLIIDLVGDPTYRTLEPHVLDDAAGDVVVLLTYRHDGHIELYAPTGRTIDPEGYDGLGKGLEIHHAPFERARFDVTDDGLKLDIALTAANGRRFDLRLHEHLNGTRDRFPALAPVGSSFVAPEFFPFLWLPGLSFVPERGTEVDMQVDGQARSIPRLPLPLGGRRCLMARYDPDVLVCQLNPESHRHPRRVPRRASTGPHTDGIELVQSGDGHGIVAVRVDRGGHSCAVLLDPPLPDLEALPNGAQRSGSIVLQADGATELRARYAVTRTEERVDLVIDGFTPWRTRTRRPLLAVLFRLPIFRAWPPTYRWDATLDLSGTAPGPFISRWSRSPAR